MNGSGARQRPGQLRLVLGTAALLLLVAVVWYMANRRGGGGGAGQAAEVTLSPEEEQMRGLVREVYGDHIVRETLRRESGDAVLALELREEKLQTAEVNLTGLARKHRDGTSLMLLKAFLRRE